MRTSVKIGRDNTNDVIINEPSVSRNHALITDLSNDTYEVKDLGSSNGTFVNGKKIMLQIIRPGDKVQVATSTVDWLTAFKAPPLKGPISLIEEEPFSVIRKTIMLGSAYENDIVLDNRFVSAHHAKISLLKSGEYYLQDMGSSNGSFVNGARILAKNFSKTDLVKMANADLPANWFEHKKLVPRFIKDHKKPLLISSITLILLSGLILGYVNRCKWFGWDCTLIASEIYSKNQNTLVHIEHEYFYTIIFNNTKYYVGKNKYFTNQTEANTDKNNLLPYNTISGNGTFINTDGAVLTSRMISNPWLNGTAQITMLQEVISSKTIKGLSTSSLTDICGETSLLKWIPNGVVYSQQNFTEASSIIACSFTDSTSALLQSVKKTLPYNGVAASIYYDTTVNEHLHHTDDQYYASFEATKNGTSLKDTFYIAKDTINVNQFKTLPLSHSLPPITEGSGVFNSRGELIGVVEQKQLKLLSQFIKQIKN